MSRAQAPQEERFDRVSLTLLHSRESLRVYFSTPHFYFYLVTYTPAKRDIPRQSPYIQNHIGD